MPESGGLDIFGPEEDGRVSEELSEEAKQRFAAAAKAMKQLKRDEKRAKKKDDQVARTIIQFLNATSKNDGGGTRFFLLISKLVARNCPSIFVLGVLSLINDECEKMVREYFAEHDEPGAHEKVDENTALVKGVILQKETNRRLIDWMTCLQMILTHSEERVMDSLMLDEKHLDGSLLQLTTFVLQEFFENRKNKELPYDHARPLAASILQTIFGPFLRGFEKPAPE